MKFGKIYVHFKAVKPVLKPMTLLDKCFLPFIHSCSPDICPRGMFLQLVTPARLYI